MRTLITKWASISVLLLAVMFWEYAARYQLALDVVVSAAAAVIGVQAARAGKHRWAGIFVAIAVLFNPAMPAFPLAGPVSLLVVAASAVAFALSLSALKPAPLLSVPSITDRTPGSQSL